jgi:hypothetical protein
MTLTNDEIKEIAEQLDCGFRCFIHKQSKELIFIPDILKNPDMDMEVWAEEDEKLHNDFLSYYEIEQIQSHDSFQIMEDFADTLNDSNILKEKLFKALSKSKPFRNFKYEIDNSGDYRQKWFDFKSEWLINRIRIELKQLEESQ